MSCAKWEIYEGKVIASDNGEFETQKAARAENLRRKIVIMEKRVYDHLDTLGKLKADYEKLLNEVPE
jgi:predicted nuclease of restriction endonuclease-like (RecB) superfamily